MLSGMGLLLSKTYILPDKEFHSIEFEQRQISYYQTIVYQKSVQTLKSLLDQLIPHTIHDQSANGFGIYLGLHILPDGFNGAWAQENYF